MLCYVALRNLPGEWVTQGEAFTLRDCLSWCCPSLRWRASRGTARERAPITEGDARDPATSDVTQDRGSAKLGTPLRGKGEDRGQAGYLGAAAGSDGAGEGAEPLEMVTVKGSGSDVEAMLPLVLVQGVEVPLDAPVAQLWGALRHPDHFLYVVVRKRR